MKSRAIGSMPMKTNARSPLCSKRPTARRTRTPPLKRLHTIPARWEIPHANSGMCPHCVTRTRGWAMPSPSHPNSNAR